MIAEILLGFLKLSLAGFILWVFWSIVSAWNEFVSRGFE